MVLTVSAAVGLALLMRFNHGNVAVLWPPWRIDLSVNLALVIVLASFVAIHLLLLAIGKALELPLKVRQYREGKARDTGVAALRDALVALFEGRFGRAERLAQQAREQADLALPAALIAARAAHRMREPARRDRWLEAIETQASSDQVKRVSEAEFAIDDGRPLDAVQSIAGLQHGGVRHIHSLRLALKAAEQAQDWPRVLQLARQLGKRDALHPTASRGLRVRAIRHQLSALPQADAVERFFNQLPPDEQSEPEVVEAAAAAMVRTGASKAAWKLIEQALGQRWSNTLARLFMELPMLVSRDKLMRAERWMERFPEEPELQLILGELCMVEALWGKAEAFLKKAAQSPPTAASAHLQLAILNERLERPARSAEHYRKSALLFSGSSDAAPAVHLETGPGDELSLVRGEKQGRVGDVTRLGEASQGN